MLAKPICFFVMPFSADMHYFYLYIRKHVEEKHNLICERADDRVTTLPMSEKVRSAIQRADVIVADCTGRNPNVMYEVGLAHAFERKVVLLTSDPIESIPSDLRQFEFVKYDRSDQLNAVCPKAQQGTKDEFTAKHRAADSAGEIITPVRLLAFIVSNVTDPEVMQAIVDFEPKEPT